MKSIFTFFLLLLMSECTWAFGQKLTVFEATSIGGIWDHTDFSDDFYINTEIAGLAKGVWGGFKKTSPNEFEGTIVFDDTNNKQVTYKATATLLYTDGGSLPMTNKKVFILTVPDLKKEFLLKKN